MNLIGLMIILIFLILLILIFILWQKQITHLVLIINKLIKFKILADFKITIINQGFKFNIRKKKIFLIFKAN